MVDNDEKILKALEALQADVTSIKTEHGKQFDGIEKRQEQQGTILTGNGKMLTYLTGSMGTVLQEQQQLPTDIRSLHDDLHRIEQKVDRIAIDVKNNKERIENLEEHTGTPNPHKH